MAPDVPDTGQIAPHGGQLVLKFAELGLCSAHVHTVVLHALDLILDFLEAALELLCDPLALELLEHGVLELIDAAVERFLLTPDAVHLLSGPQLLLELVQLVPEALEPTASIGRIDTIVLHVLEALFHFPEPALELAGDGGDGAALFEGVDLALELVDDPVPPAALHLLDLAHHAPQLGPKVGELLVEVVDADAVVLIVTELVLHLTQAILEAAQPSAGLELALDSLDVTVEPLESAAEPVALYARAAHLFYALADVVDGGAVRLGVDTVILGLIEALFDIAEPVLDIDESTAHLDLFP